MIESELLSLTKEHGDEKISLEITDDMISESELDEEDDPLFEKNLISSSPLSSRFSYISKHVPKLPISSTIATYIKSFLLALLPSYINNLITRTPSKGPSSQGIAALDGLRGLACLFVFHEHYTRSYSTSFLFGYGFKDDHRTPMHWPFIRLMFSGKVMVNIFFVISGYVLSYKPLKSIRSKSSEEFSKSIASSVIRRALRLYLPPIAAILLCVVAVNLGSFSRARYIFYTQQDYLNRRERPPPDLGSLWQQLLDGTKDCLRMIDTTIPWKPSIIRATWYDKHLWTIPVEFRSSMALFITLVGTSRLRSSFRLAYHCGLIVYTLWTERTDVCLFFAGMTLAEIDMVRKDRYTAPKFQLATITAADTTSLPVSTPPPMTLPRRARIHPHIVSVLWVFVFVFGLYVASAPLAGGVTAPGYRFIFTHFPSHFKYPADILGAVGSVFAVWAVANSPLLAPLFTNPVSHYLGKISYALYLVHGNVLKSLGYVVIPWTFQVVGKGVPKAEMTNAGWVKAWLIGYVCLLPPILWLSDLFWRGIDIRCVTFARWAEGKVSVS